MLSYLSSSSKIALPAKFRTEPTHPFEISAQNPPFSSCQLTEENKTEGFRSAEKRSEGRAEIEGEEAELNGPLSPPPSL